MSTRYNHKTVENKWQQYWSNNQTVRTSDDNNRPKKYVLVEFPYPSGEGLHMGHLRPYVAGDVFSRYWRLKGFNTLYPMGWDAFGLPAENYAIKKGIAPRISTQQNVDNAKRQLQNWGLGFDWNREINTTDPGYYKWTQWIFLQIYKAGLAYEATGLINWCPKDKTGLANEEVIDGKCERCGTVVEKKKLRQWYLKITAYADKLLAGLDSLPLWPQSVKLQQSNWIGKSEGLEEYWQVQDMNLRLTTFTTWPHTTWGATFMVIAPEHPLINDLVKGTEYEIGAKEFAQQCIEEKIKDPLNVDKAKKGFFLGRYAINHLTGWKMPIYIANFAIYDYGTGIVKCTPAHDQRDFEFAQQYGLPMKLVVRPENETWEAEDLKEAYTGEGIMLNAGEFTGMNSMEARKSIAEYTIQKGEGKFTTNYKMRDWVFSRQRYWGEPIPIIHCPACGIVPVPEEELPVRLPEVERYEPTGTGESPLAGIAEWVNVPCPKCQGAAKRETNTMPQWAGSSWYFLRYLDPGNGREIASQDKLSHWLPVDVYFGGMEHTTLHLLYSRFWNLVLYDQGIVPAQEPYIQRVPHGIILASDGEKMSKSRGNVVNPDDIVKEYGADTLRLYELFLGPHEATVSWDDRGIVGVRRFYERVWNWAQQLAKSPASQDSESAQRTLHRLIKKVGEDIENFRFNTAVAAFMSFHNEIKDELVTTNLAKQFLIVLYPFAPHIAEELNELLGGKDSLQHEAWPEYDPALAAELAVELVIQVNGKVKDKLPVAPGLSEEESKALALESAKIKAVLGGQEPRRVIVVPGKLVNIVL